MGTRQNYQNDKHQQTIFLSHAHLQVALPVSHFVIKPSHSELKENERKEMLTICLNYLWLKGV